MGLGVFRFYELSGYLPDHIADPRQREAQTHGWRCQVFPSHCFGECYPERDTPELLGRYINYFGDGNLAVTGELAEIVKLTTPLGIYFEKNRTDDENYGVVPSRPIRTETSVSRVFRFRRFFLMTSPGPSPGRNRSGSGKGRSRG